MVEVVEVLHKLLCKRGGVSEIIGRAYIGIDVLTAQPRVVPVTHVKLEPLLKTWEMCQRTRRM